MIMDRIPRREQRATFKDADGWMAEWLQGGRRTVSGEAVGPTSALSLSGYFSAIRNISEDVAKMPLDVIRKRPGSRKRTKMREHPAYQLLNVAPNPEMDPVAFRECLLHHAMGWGNGVAEIVRNRGGVPVELWPIDPTHLTIKHDEDNSLMYEIRGVPGQSDVILRPDQVLHVHGLGYDGVRGYSVARLARETIGLGLAEVKAGAALFGNSSRPDGVLTVQGRLNKEGQVALREGWEENYRGTDNAHRMAILHSGATFSPISVNNEDAQWIQARQFTVEELCRWLRIPPSKVGHLMKANFNTLEMQNMEYVTDTLLSWMIRVEQQVRRKLISANETDVYAKHNAMGILRGDIATRYGAYATARQWGWESANSILELEDRDGIGKDGDIYLVPGNMLDASKVNDPKPAPAAIPQPKAADGQDDAPAAVEKLAISMHAHDRLSRSKCPADAVQAIVWSHEPVFTDTFIRIADRVTSNNKKKNAETNATLAYEWISSAATSCVDAVWGVLRDGDQPDSVVNGTHEWSRGVAGRLIGRVAECNGDGPAIVNDMVTTELGNLDRMLCGWHNITQKEN